MFMSVCVSQILSYLMACDHLCQLGHDMAQVEEALEIFQNSETKVCLGFFLNHYLLNLSGNPRSMTEESDLCVLTVRRVCFPGEGVSSPPQSVQRNGLPAERHQGGAARS